MGMGSVHRNCPGKYLPMLDRRRVFGITTRQKQSIEGLIAPLTASHADLLARVRDLGLACGRLSYQSLEEDAAAATDFIAQCQLHLKQAPTRSVRRTPKGPCIVALIPDWRSR
jgi:hypothetical protein